MERIRQEFNLTDKLEAVAEFYGYSLRRFYDRVAQGKVLGVTHVPGYGIIFWSDGPYEIVGPFPGGRTTILVPPDTVGVVPYCSGLMSGFPLVTGLNLSKEHPEVTISFPPFHSGKIVQVFHS
jgi:hypothetical protein